MKASVVAQDDLFGEAISVSADGSLMVVGAGGLGSGSNAGFVEVYERSNGAWRHLQRLTASNAGAGDHLGWTAVISGDGSTIAAGAWGEDTSTGGVNPTPNENAQETGAVYVFRRTTPGGTWSQEAMLKASNPEAYDWFGDSLVLSYDGTVLAAGADGEDSAGTGVNSAQQANNGATDSGAVYIFTRSSGGWAQAAYVKASNTGADDGFGTWLALSADGSTLAVTAWGEDSSGRGVNAPQGNNASLDSGALYVFRRTLPGGSWAQDVYIKASNADSNDEFPWGLALSADGTVLAAGTGWEDSSSASAPGNNGLANSGAVYVFTRGAGPPVWTQTAFLKAATPAANDEFGRDVALSQDGTRLLVGCSLQDALGTGLDPGGALPNSNAVGAAYVFDRDLTGLWTQSHFLKPSNPEAQDEFGFVVGLSANGLTAVVGAHHEDGSGTGVNPPSNNGTANSGAAYIFTLP